MRFGWPSFIDVQFPLSRNETFCGPGHFQKRGNGGVFRGQMVPFVELLGDNDSGVMLCGGEGVRSFETDRGIERLHVAGVEVEKSSTIIQQKRREIIHF